MIKYSNLSITQKLLFDFRDQINEMKQASPGSGVPIIYEIFDDVLQSHPEYVTFYIDLFHLSKDREERDVLATIIIGVGRYGPVEDYLRNLPDAPWNDKSFSDLEAYENVKLTKKEIDDLMTKPRGQRLTYDPQDEIVVSDLINSGK
ncbi:hypothetical protein ACES2L_00710 [Bdellovibrio bacteriovorus]